MYFFLATDQDYPILMEMIPDRVIQSVRNKDFLLFAAVSDEDRIAGTMLCTAAYPGLRIEWLQILPNYREQGYASGLLDFVVNHLQKYTDMEYLDLIYGQHDVPETVHDFITKNGFETGWQPLGIYEFTISDASDMADKVENVKTKNICSIAEIPAAELTKLYRFCDFRADMNVYDKDLSFVSLKSDEIKGAIFVKKLHQCYEIDWFQGNSGIPMIAIELVARLLRQAKTLEEDSRWITSPVDKTSKKLLLKMIPGAREIIGKRAVYYI